MKHFDLTPELLEELRQICARDHVAWSTFAETCGSYDLELHGTHAHPGHEPVIGCPKCRAVYDDLWRVAQCVVPQAPGCAMEIFHGSRSSTNGIALTVRAERSCFHEAERRLLEAGARQSVH